MAKTRQGASRREREFSFLSAGSGWAWEKSGEINRVDLHAFRLESRAPTQRLHLRREYSHGPAQLPLGWQRLGPRRLQLHAIGRCLLRSVRPPSLLEFYIDAIALCVASGDVVWISWGTWNPVKIACAKRQSAIDWPVSPTPALLVPCWAWLRSNGESWRKRQRNGRRPASLGRRKR